MATLDLQDGSVGLAAVAFVSADSCGDQVQSGTHNGSWTKGFFLLVKNAGMLDCCCDPVLIKVFVNVTGHDECDCCSPIASAEYEVPSDGGLAFIPITQRRLGQLVTIEYADASDLLVAAVTSLEGYVIPPGEEECCC